MKNKVNDLLELQFFIVAALSFSKALPVASWRNVIHGTWWNRLPISTTCRLKTAGNTPKEFAFAVPVLNCGKIFDHSSHTPYFM
ncbi:MAG TPA: hypothetical protein PK951_06370 [Chitinophagaceae bacterium]|nr:hypothetical protein [Chitinophagaceae bacterium]